MLRENEAAYEATQEVFLAAWQGLRGFKGKARFATWLYRITYHQCLRVAEAQKREMSLRAELRAESARAQRPEQVVSVIAAGVRPQGISDMEICWKCATTNGCVALGYEASTIILAVSRDRGSPA